jgi:DNA-binding NtrC family response regulator
VRELQHVIERAVILSQNSTIDAGDLPDNLTAVAVKS